MPEKFILNYVRLKQQFQRNISIVFFTTVEMIDLHMESPGENVHNHVAVVIMTNTLHIIQTYIEQSITQSGVHI